GGRPLHDRARRTPSATRYATPAMAPSCTNGVPSRPCAHSQPQAMMIELITTRPASAVAARSMRAQRSSRPSPRNMRIVSLRPPSASTAAMRTKNAMDVRPDWRSPPFHWAAPRPKPRTSVNAGRNQRVEQMRRLMAASCMEDLLDRSLEEPRERNGERQRRRVATGLDSVDGLPRDLHLLRQITLREPSCSP